MRRRCLSSGRTTTSEVSILVSRQLIIISQVDAFTISATRKIQYAFKKLLCLIVFVKDLLDIYLNEICHDVFSFNSVC